MPGTHLPAVSKARATAALPWPWAPIIRIRNLSYFVASHELQQESGGCGLRDRKSKGRRRRKPPSWSGLLPRLQQNLWSQQPLCCNWGTSAGAACPAALTHGEKVQCLLTWAEVFAHGSWVGKEHSPVLCCAALGIWAATPKAYLPSAAVLGLRIAHCFFFGLQEVVQVVNSCPRGSGMLGVPPNPSASLGMPHPAISTT